jgi:hypothetical protein
MQQLTLDFYTVEEKEPPIEKPLLLELHNGNFQVSHYIKDEEYGPIFNDFEGYCSPKRVKQYAILPPYGLWHF